ncbi:MAG: N-acyl homoserine lactonase family protein [Alphaproteobacteria bacterium]
MSGQSETWELYAIKYATMQERKRSDNFISPDGHEDAPMPIDYFVWAAVGKDRSFVIDTGFGPKVAGQRGRSLLRTASEALAMIGVDAASAPDVIVTHLHYDHIGGFEQFPAARYHLQEREMQFATGPHMCTAAMNHPFEADHIAGMVHKVFEGRVAFHDGDSELAPGITLHFVGGHTMGMQVVRVRTKRGWVVLASDASHFYENMEAVSPFPIVYNVGDMVRGYETLRNLASSPQHIIPGHDPQVLTRYKAPNKALQGIAVRLDGDPD